MLIKVKVTPCSNKNKIISQTKDLFDIHVKTRPVHGSANSAVISILSKHFQIPEKDIKIIKGIRLRNKIFKLKI